MTARDHLEEQERQRKREDILASMESEDRLIKLAPVLSEFETVPPVADPSLAPGAMMAGVPLSEKRKAPPLLESLTMPDGSKLKITPIHGQREAIRAQHEAESARKMLEGTEVLSQEAYDKLPEFYKARWKPGQRVDSKTVGEIGAAIFQAAEKKAEREATLKAKEAEAAGKPPPTRHGPRGQIQDWINGRWVDQGPIADPNKATGGADDPKAKFQWVTDSSSGQRVRVSEQQLNEAPPGKYSDAKPNQPRVNLSGQAAQARSSAEKTLGSATDPESIWGIAHKWTVPGPGALMGPAAAAIGVSASVNKALRGPGSDDLRQYESIIEGLTPVFARAVGHTGTLTEKDELRTRKLFPVLSGPGADTREEATRKLKRLQKFMSGQEVVPPGMFDVQPGHWPPADQQSQFSPEETSLMADYGYPTGGQ